MSTSALPPVRPLTGGFFWPFGTAWFIVEFLKGRGPEGSPRIALAIGATMTDIHFQYKSALHRAYARDAVEMEEEKRQAWSIGLLRGRLQRAAGSLSRPDPLQALQDEICQFHPILWTLAKAWLDQEDRHHRAIDNPGRLPGCASAGLLPTY